MCHVQIRKMIFIEGWSLFWTGSSSHCLSIRTRTPFQLCISELYHLAYIVHVPEYSNSKSLIKKSMSRFSCLCNSVFWTDALPADKTMQNSTQINAIYLMHYIYMCTYNSVYKDSNSVYTHTGFSCPRHCSKAVPTGSCFYIICRTAI